MRKKEFKVIVPDGYEIDYYSSTFECIKFKPKKKCLNYKEVAKALFIDKLRCCFYSNYDGSIEDYYAMYDTYFYPTYATSEKQLEKLLAINKLMNVAKYLNEDWKPDWKDYSQSKYYILIGRHDIDISDVCATSSNVVYFKTRELAQQAIDILGEETIRLALSTDW